MKLQIDSISDDELLREYTNLSIEFLDITAKIDDAILHKFEKLMKQVKGEAIQEYEKR